MLFNRRLGKQANTIAKSRLVRCLRASQRTLSKAFRQAVGAGTGAGRALLLSRCTGSKADDRLVPLRFCTGVRTQVNGRTPAARAGD